MNKTYKGTKIEVVNVNEIRERKVAYGGNIVEDFFFFLREEKLFYLSLFLN